MSRFVLGVDASGPANPRDTAACVLDVGGATPRYVLHRRDLDDAALLAIADAHRPGLVVGLDAPLSYEDGGGDRAADRDLREVLRGVGLPSGTVMAPTFTRMVYLTVRGMHLARSLGAARIVEVHPGGVMAMRGADVADVMAVKRDPDARRRLVAWLRATFVADLPDDVAETDHDVMAAAAAVGAWQWSIGQARWCRAATPPAHPFDVAA
jgi:predicted nuclease with RNAse H fold